MTSAVVFSMPPRGMGIVIVAFNSIIPKMPFKVLAACKIFEYAVDDRMCILFGKTCRASMTCKNRDFNIFEMLEDLYNPANELTKPVLEVVTEYSDSNGKRTKMVKYNAVSYDKDGRRYHVPMIPKKASDVAKIEMFLNE